MFLIKAFQQLKLGPKTLCLYHAYCATNSDAMLYQRECRILSDRTNAIVHVGARVDDKLICLANAYPARYSQTTLPGGAFPFHASAIGKSILAFMDESHSAVTPALLMKSASLFMVIYSSVTSVPSVFHRIV